MPLAEVVTQLRSELNAGQTALATSWSQRRQSRDYLRGRAALVDNAIISLWATLEFPASWALAAVGGYGRGELFPYSDVDLLILLPDAAQASEQQSRLSDFIGALWDLGLDIGHSVRTIDECLHESAQDITVETALLEARQLTGNEALFAALLSRYRLALNPTDFLKAKLSEQTERYARHHDTPYALEPNCKESPGGLRDLHLIIWVAAAASIGRDWTSLSRAGLLRATEARQLALAEQRLLDLRMALHLQTRRAEDRLLFDHQDRLAQTLGLHIHETRRPSEILMQLYYRNARRVTLLSAMVIPALTEHLLPDRAAPATILDANFQIVHDRLDARDLTIFEREPRAILDCFLWQMKRSDVRGMSTQTQRALWHARRGIDERFRATPENKALFLSLFQQPHLIRVLRRMNQYDILGRYLPAFGRVVGQMQHDLFHAYTVDQHILQVMRNLRRFAMPEFAHEYPFCSRLMVGIERNWLLYLAALFHDIAKGRGGDHSKLGMDDARQFGVDHALPAEDTALLVFLVEHHLTMSTVAQKQDLADPDVIRRFVAIVGDHRRLTALYLLTVADIRGTSPKVWNSWKARLLEDLFRRSAALLHGDTAGTSSNQPERQEDARRLLRQRGLRPDIETALWAQLDVGYFMRHEAEEIAWHTRTLYHRPDSPTPVISARLLPHFGGVQVMVYVADQPLLFARLCHAFSRLGYDIVDAKVHTTRHGFALDSFIVVSADADGYRESASLLEHELGQQLTHNTPLPAALSARLSRQVKHFPITPQVSIQPDEKRGLHIMSITAANRVGLLYALAKVLAQHDIRIHTAKVATLGERVEDVFLISGKKLESATALVLFEKDLLAALAV
jgi:[protein-PII] uridylyltransferase